MNPSESNALKISVVVPVYKGAATLKELFERTCATMQSAGYSFEVVFVNDGSPDNSWDVLANLQRQYPDQVVAVNLTRNFGQHNAYMCGFGEARGQIIVTIDDDLQNPPEDIPALVQALETRGDDLIYGRFSVKQHAGWRNAGSQLTQMFYRFVFGRKHAVTACRALRRELAQSILAYSLNYTYIDGLFAWHTNRISEIEVHHHERKIGTSGYSIGKLVALAINLFTNFSLLPLQVVATLGLSVALVGLSGGAYVLWQKLLNNIEVPGYASVIIAVLVLGGIQMLCLGVLGEYVGRLHLNVNRKPQYVKRQVLRSRA